MDALDEFRGRARLRPRLALQHDAGEDLHQHIVALDVDEDLVAHDGDVGGLWQLVAHQLPQVDIDAATEHPQDHRLGRQRSVVVGWHGRERRDRAAVRRAVRAARCSCSVFGVQEV